MCEKESHIILQLDCSGHYIFCQQAVLVVGGYHVANLEELVKVEWDENERDAAWLVVGSVRTILHITNARLEFSQKKHHTIPPPYHHTNSVKL